MFLKNDGSLANVYSYKNVYNNIITISSGGTFLSLNVSPSRIAKSLSRIYHGTIYSNNNSLINGSQMIIYDKNNGEVARINNDISGNRSDTALIYYDENSNYLLNRSLRTSTSSDIGSDNNILIKHLNTFSDNSVIIGGEFNTNEIRIYNESNVQLGLIQSPIVKTTIRPNDNFFVKFDSAGNLLHYNYLRISNPTLNSFANCRISYINTDTSDNYYVVGSFAPQTTGLFQIYDVNSTSTVLYDTSGYQANLNTPSGNNLYNSSTNSAHNYIIKYNSSGQFQWFAPTYNNINDGHPDMPYYVGSVGSNILAVYYCGSSLGPGQLMRIYHGKTATQRDTSGVLYASVDLSNNTQTPTTNQIIVNYDSSGQVQWVKSFEGFYIAPILSNNISLLGADSISFGSTEISSSMLELLYCIKLI
jgi:hypothetical protein